MTVGVVCAGAGWATGERHLPALAGDPRVEVVGIVDRHLDRARVLAERFGVRHVSASLEEPWLDDVECLTVGAPPWEHADLVEVALDRGWSCLCEKPFALPAARAAELAARARERGTVLAVVHNFQFSRAGLRLFDLVESGRLGAIEAVYGFQLSNHRRRLPHWYRGLVGGLFLDEAAHLLYLLRRILGTLRPRAVDARLEGLEIRDLVATFAHDDVWAALAMSFDASVSEWQLVVVGAEGVAAMDVFRDLLVVVPNDRGHTARDVLRSSVAMLAGHAGGFVRSGVEMVRGRLTYGNDEVVRRFVDAVLGDRDRIRWMTGEDGAAVVTCIEELLGRTGLELRAPDG